MTILLTLQFDGSRYCGFQVQKNGLSICQVVQDGLEALLGVRPPVKGCGRTDAGVHALGYALSFSAQTRIPMEKLPLALNHHLPPDVRAVRAQQVPEDFHARYSAHSKTYCYRIHCSMVDSPFESAYCHRIPGTLDVQAMQQAADAFVGTHDFMALCSAGSSVAAKGDTVRTIYSCQVQRQGEHVTITVSANGYLYNMVRILAGTLMQAGQGQRSPASIPELLQSRDRAKAGPTLPAKGLFLVRVDYPELEASPDL